VAVSTYDDTDVQTNVSTTAAAQLTAWKANETNEKTAVDAARATYHTCRTNLRTAKPGCLSALKNAAKEKYDGGAIKKNCQDWADREGVESAFGNAACRLFTVPAPNYTSIPVKDSSTEACSGQGSPWTSDTPSCGDTHCCCMTKHCVRKELRRYRNAQRANCKATWKVAKQAYKDYRQLGRKLRFRVHVVPFVMNLLRKPVTKYLGDMDLTASMLKAANEAVTAPNSSITSVDVLETYILNQINLTVTGILTKVWANATGLLWKGVDLIWNPLIEGIVTSINEIPFVGPILGMALQEIADICYNKIQAYVTNKFLNPLAVKVETKIIDTIMNLTIKIGDDMIKRFDPSGQSQIAQWAEGAARSLIKATLGPVQTKNAGLGTSNAGDTNQITANGNSESAEASTDDQTDENDEDGQDTADSNGDGDEDDS